MTCQRAVAKTHETLWERKTIMRFEGKHAVLTGGASGIGAAILTKLKEQGL